MSRSNPTENNPNPCQRWFEWDGSNGKVRWYDKEAKKNVEVGDDMTFILLDQLACIRGWHDASDSAIYSNEIRDSRVEQFLVKSFKAKQPIADGYYKDIKHIVGSAGGSFTTNLYIAYKEDGVLRLGSLMLKGAAMSAWVEFRNANRKAIYYKAVQIKGATYGKKGKIEFYTPKFHIRDINDETNEAAKEIDRTLQEYLKGYFKRTTTSRVEHPAADEPPTDEERPTSHDEPPAEDDDIPF